VVKNYESVRFFLFANSYSGKIIVSLLREGYQNKKLLKRAKRLSQVLDFSYEQLRSFILRQSEPTCPYQRVPSDLRIYLEIEKELAKLIEEKLDEYSTAKEDYQRKLLSPAFERAAGNLIQDLDDDRKFQEALELRIQKYAYVYYKIAYKYKLPTMRVVPFILRIIS